MYGRTIRDRLAPLQPFRRARLEKSPAPNSPAGVSLGGRVAASMYGRIAHDRLALLEQVMEQEVHSVDEVYVVTKAWAPNNGILISGCQTNQTTADATTPLGVSFGALSNSIQTILANEHGKVTNEDLVMKAPELLSRQGLYDSDIGGRPWNKKSLYKCSGLPPMSEAEAHAFEVNSFGLYNELSELVELGGADNNLNTSNVETTDYLMLPPDRELSANDYMELNDLLALDPSFSSEFSAQDNQYMQHPLAQYNGHYDLSGPSEPTMPSIFDVFPPNNGVLATDDPANYLDPAMQFPFS
ncbi:hypothetical protein ZEAMMB73_Zm00001d053993 [Zea mays]|uniref:Uncharacterized protein n=1 Tax=Zea mays TaxID=4577 RepID=A0A1D6QU62_MAIZE|nr:hypothetical protein ZEAMMB73_Zm00001d053993 [Zea mays]